MKQIYILLYFTLFHFCLFQVAGQTCNDKTGKSIKQDYPETASCATYTARDEVRFLPGFKVSSVYQGKTKKILLTWSYSNVYSGWYPYVTINSKTLNGISLPTSYNFGNLVSSLTDLVSKLSTQLGTGWSVSMTSDGSNGFITIENLSNFTNPTGNFKSSSISQNYEAPGSSTFNAKVDNGLMFPVSYLSSYSVNPETRALDKTNCSFGSLPGEVNVSASGAATYDIPINVLPGINGMAPQIAINYTSQGGNGMLGWGWSLSGLSTISRVSQNVYSDEFAEELSLGTDDRFSLNGNRLVVTSGTYGAEASLYRTETESFVIVKAHVSNVNNGPDWFEVVDKNGTTFKYGSATGRVVVDRKNFSWQLDYVQDVNGNYMQYTYENTGPVSCIKKIEYGRNINDNTLVTNTVEIYYETRADVMQFKVLQNTATIDKIINRIRVARGNMDYRNFTFEYAKDIYSRLVKINLTNNKSETVNSTIIKWGTFNNAIALNNNVTAKTSNQSYFGVNTDNQYYTSYDVNNDGKSDLIGLHPNYTDYNTIKGSAYEVYSNKSDDDKNIQFSNGGIPFITYYDMSYDDVYSKSHGTSIFDLDKNGTIDYINPVFVHASDNTIYFDCKINGTQFGKSYIISSNALPACSFSDYNNDSKTDIFFIDQDTHVGSLILFNLNDIQNPQKIDFNLSFNGKAKDIYEGDYNGDGLIDLLVVSDQGSYIFKNNGGASNSLFSASPWVSSTNFLKSSYKIIKQGDFNADGTIDFIYEVSRGNWKLAIGTNTGSFNITNLPFTDIGDDPDTGDDDQSDNCYVFDFDLDGKSDIVLADYVSHWDGANSKKFDHFDVYWYKSTGTGFSSHKKITTNQEKDTYIKYFVMGDFNGDGRADLMNYGSDLLNNSNSERKWRLYASGSVNGEDGMVTSIANGAGQKTKISYTSMVWAKNYTPQSVYQTNLYTKIFPLSIVDTIENIKSIGPNEILTYAYKQATFNNLAGFLGFAETSVANNRTTLKTTMAYDFAIALNTDENLYLPLLKNTTQRVGNTTISSNITQYKLHPYGGKRAYIYPNGVTSSDQLNYKKTVITSTIDTDGNASSVETKFLGNNDEEVAKSIATSSNFAIRVNGSLNTIPSLPATITTTKTHKDDPGKTFSETTVITYDNKGRVYTRLNNGVTSTFTYDDYGNLLKASDAIPDGTGTTTRSINYAMDATKRFVGETKNDKEHKTIAEYDNWGNKTKVTDVNDLSTLLSYNNWGTLISQTAPDGTVLKTIINWTTNDSDAPTNSLYAVYSYKDNILLSADYYNPDGYIIRKLTIGNFGVKLYTQYTYNSNGELWKVSEPYPFGSSPSLETVYEYDNFKRLYKVTSPDGLVSSNTFPTSTDRTYKTTLNNGEESAKTYDAAGLVAVSTDKGGSVTYKYHASWQPSSIKANESTTAIEYYDNGLQKKLDDPDHGIISYKYNAFGELSEQTDAKGNVTKLTFDILGRVDTKTVGANIYKYTYDPVNGKGLIASETCTNDATIAGYNYTYDGLSRLNVVTRNNSANSFTYTYQYGSGSKVSSIIYPNNFQVKYSYNSYDDLIRVDDNNNNLIWKIDENDAKGRVTKTTSGSQKQLTINYDTNDRLSGLSVPNIINFGYNFNNRGQLDWREEKYFNGSQMNGFKERFGYDNVNRLLTARNETTGIETLHMVYQTTTSDRIGSKSDAGTYVYDETTNHMINKLTAVASYTPPQHDLTYTDEGKVATVKETNGEGNKLLSIDYGLDAQRFKSEYSENNTRKYTRYYFDTYEKEVMHDNTTRHLNYIYAGGNLIAIFEQKSGGDKMHYVYTDYLGSLRCITDANGNIEQRLSFDAWGNRRDPYDGHKLNETETTAVTTLTSRGFTGHEHIDGLALINMNGRIYDPMLGMFISPDNYVQAPYSSQNYNRFTYCLNNPLMYTDPSGEVFGIDGAIIVGMIIYQVGFGLSMYGQMTGNATLYKIGNYGMVAGTIVMGYGFSAMGTWAGIIGNGFMGGFNNSLNGGSFGEGFLRGAAMDAIFAGLSYSWDKLGNLKLPASTGLNEALSAPRSDVLHQLYNTIDNVGKNIPSLVTDGTRLSTMPMPSERTLKSEVLNEAIGVKSRSVISNAVQSSARVKNQPASGQGDKNLNFSRSFTGSHADGSEYFEGVRIFTNGSMSGAAATLPGVGIIVKKGLQYNTQLLRHEFGHILQAQLWGKDFYYSTIVPVSLKSAATALDHDNTWTEWSASRLSWEYFGRPSDWNYKYNPISPTSGYGNPHHPLADQLLYFNLMWIKK
jgi:RHS repeat-associated protein